MQNLVKIQQFIVKILGKNEILTSVMKLQKMMCNNPNIALVIINLYAKFGESPSIHKILNGNEILTSQGQ